MNYSKHPVQQRVSIRIGSRQINAIFLEEQQRLNILTNLEYGTVCNNDSKLNKNNRLNIVYSIPGYVALRVMCNVFCSQIENQIQVLRMESLTNTKEPLTELQKQAIKLARKLDSLREVKTNIMFGNDQYKILMECGCWLHSAN